MQKLLSDLHPVSHQAFPPPSPIPPPPPVPAFVPDFSPLHPETERKLTGADPPAHQFPQHAGGRSAGLLRLRALLTSSPPAQEEGGEVGWGGGVGLISLPPSPVRQHVLQNDALPSSSGSLDTHSVSTRMEEEEGEVMEERRRPMGGEGRGR